MPTAPTALASPPPVPPGADEASEWWEERDARAYRIVYSYRTNIGGENLTVRGSAIQYTDGSIDNGRLEARASPSRAVRSC